MPTVGGVVVNVVFGFNVPPTAMIIRIETGRRLKDDTKTVDVTSKQ